ncbi:MAG: cysteine desulfurase [Synergistaceae bacterium]|nr:cysteine desulfurase [Synergistaceae bacterium]
MDFISLRKDFSLLRDVVYLDSAAISLAPTQVTEATMEYYREYNANVKRGVHRLSQMASQKYKNAHRKIARFINADEDEIALTKNTTESINMVAAGLSWKEGDRVISTISEHHSNFLPWKRLERFGVEVDLLAPRQDGAFDLGQLEALIGPRTRLLAMTHISSVLGTVSPIEEAGRICAEKNVLFLVDGAQSVPHVPVDVRKLGCDFLCFSGHKMLGPTGTGVLWMRKKFLSVLEPLLYGGGMIRDVAVDGFELIAGYERFEGGTPNIAGFLGLGRAVDYLTEIGMDAVQARETVLTERMLDGLTGIDGVEIYGTTDVRRRIGVVSFNISGKNPHDVALMLDQAGDVMVRSGHHCCMPLMKHLGLADGAVRASLALYTSEEDVDRFLNTVEGISRC